MSVQGDGSYLRKGCFSEDLVLSWEPPLPGLPEPRDEALPLLDEPLDLPCWRGERSLLGLEDEDDPLSLREEDLRPLVELDWR